MKKQRDLTCGSILAAFVMFALPLFFGSLFQQLYGTVDMMFVGNFLGKSSAAAVGSSSILVTCLIGLFTGISVGAGVVTAQFWGARESENVTVCIENAFALGACGGLLLTIIGLLFSRQALRLLNVPDTILDMALVYIRIYLLSILPMIFYNLSAGILRARRDSRTPFLVLACGGFLNVGMDALLIVVLGLGVAGAALATMISQTFTAVVCTAYVFRLEQLLKKRWKINFSMSWKILSVGFPLGIQSMVLTLSNVIVQYFINGFGEDAVAAFAVYFKAENFVYLPIMAFGQAMVTFTGQNYGAGKYGRIRKGAVSCNLLSAVVTAVIAWGILLAGRQVLGIFCRDEAVIAEGLKIIHVSFPFYFIYALLEVTGGIVRGVGKSLQSMVIVIVNLCAVRVLLLLIFAKQFHRIEAVAAVYPITWTLAATSFIGCYIYLSRRMLSLLTKKEILFPWEPT